MAQGTAQMNIEPFACGKGRDLGSEAREQAPERLGAMALQREKVLELGDDLLDHLAMAGGPAAGRLRPSPPRVCVGGGRDYCPIGLLPVAFPWHGGVAFVGQIGVVSIGRDQRVADGALVARGGR